jgi:hypothetical protein
MILNYYRIVILFLLSLNVPTGLIAQNPDEGVERLKYKLKLGWFNIGSGDVSIKQDFYFQGESCYRVKAYAETMGLGSWLGSLDDTYISLINKDKMKPVFNEKHVVSSGSTWDQWSFFNYDSMSVDVKVMDHKREDPNRKWKVDLEKNTQDILGTFMFFKHHKWFNMSREDSVMLTTFYEDKLYTIGMQYMGQEIIEFNGRNVGVYRLHLLYPEHKNIKKERPIKIWISSDENQYPLLIETKLPFLGKGRVELVELNGRDPQF